MRTEFATAAATPGPTDVVARSPRRVRLDRFDLALLALFGALSLWVLALDLWQVVVNGRVWTGTDGVYIVDQLQYLSWIRDASAHVLVSNLFVLRSSPADYFQPAVVISGALSALGMAPWLSLLLWKPVAVIGCFLAMRAYVRRSMPGLWPRRAALTLAVFFGSFTVLFGTFTVLGDLFPGFLSWGYTFALLAMAAVIAALVTYDRGRAENRIPWAPPALGAVASLLHPWHGELLVLIVRRRRARAVARPEGQPRASGAGRRDGDRDGGPVGLLRDPRPGRPLVAARARGQQARFPALADRALSAAAHAAGGAGLSRPQP